MSIYFYYKHSLKHQVFDFYLSLNGGLFYFRTRVIILNENKAYFWEGDKLYRAKKIKIRELEGEKEHYYAEQASKEELIELKAKMENLKTIEKRIAIKITWKIIVDKEKINQVKDEIRSIRKIEKLNAEKKELIKKLEEIKTETLKQSNYKCSICGKKVKDVNLSVIKDLSVYAALNILEVIENRTLEIHLDINPSEKHKSSMVVKEAISYVMAQGLKPVLKPNSIAAFSVADYIVNHC